MKFFHNGFSIDLYIYIYIYIYVDIYIYYIYINIHIYIYMLSWKQCALPVITTMALGQLMHLGTWCVVIYRPIETGRVARRASALQWLLLFLFHELKKIAWKWKIMQNYKTNWNSSKIVDIYKILIELQRWHILSVMNCEKFSQF